MLEAVVTAMLSYKVGEVSKRQSENLTRRQNSWDPKHLLNLVKAQRTVGRHPVKCSTTKDWGPPKLAVVGWEEAVDALLLEAVRLPNQLHFSVPPIDQVSQSWGLRSPKCSAAEDHLTIGEKVGHDVDSGSKISGPRFSILREPASAWERMLSQLMLETQTKEHRYEEVSVPVLVKEDALHFTGHLPKFRSEMFRTEGKGCSWHLIPTSEVVLANLGRGETWDGTELPKRLVAVSSCFRLESGTSGKENRGLLRQRQFTKVEIVQMATADRSYRSLNEVLGDASAVLQKLRLHHRVLEVKAPNVPTSSARTFDIEIWMPSLRNYREASSCSNTEGYQARRLRTKYSLQRDKLFSHIINGSGLAIGRTLAAILEG